MGSIFDSNAERTRRQRRTLATLVTILRSAEDANLPPLRWSVIASETLHGQCVDFGTDARRATFDAWVDHLGAIRSPESTFLGSTHLRAAASEVCGRPARLAITAELFEVNDNGGYDR